MTNTEANVTNSARIVNEFSARPALQENDAVAAWNDRLSLWVLGCSYVKQLPNGKHEVTVGSLCGQTMQTSQVMPESQLLAREHHISESIRRQRHPLSRYLDGRAERLAT